MTTSFKNEHELEVSQGESTRAGWINPFDDMALLKYYGEVFNWHGYIKFLGLPHLKETPDVPIQRLYVEPALSTEHIRPERKLEDWPECQPVLDALAENQRLLLLGDPGSGKSTLVSWIAWQLTRTEDNAWTERLGRLVPIPMTLRELKIGRDITWDGLLREFLDHPMAEALGGREKLEGLLKTGQAIVMLDGLDEISDTSARIALRDACHSAADRYPESRWLMTTRIVGSEDVHFSKVTVTIPSGKFVHVDDFTVQAGIEVLNTPRNEPREVLLTWAAERYMAPFDDPRVDEYVGNWYARREMAEARKRGGASDLLAAIRVNEGTAHLARIPNLLTLMALVYRIEARLPHGRALLYNKIAEAYLESIDTFRGIQDSAYPPEMKKRWLAWVGYRAQCRRAADKKEREVLIERDELDTWFEEAMRRDGKGAEKAERDAFIDFIARRSGLLLPRGPDVFAFVHLSFQEYFAACALEAHVTSPKWLRRDETLDTGPNLDELRADLDKPAWHEPFVLLFELLALRPPWADALFDDLYGEQAVRLLQESIPSEKKHENEFESPAARVLAVITVDPQSGLSDDNRKYAIAGLWKWFVRIQNRFYKKEKYVHAGIGGGIAQILLSEDASRLPTIRESLHAELKGQEAHALDLSGCTSLVDLTPLKELSTLQSLYLSGCTSLVDLAPLKELSTLQSLDLSGCTSLVDLAPLKEVSTLESLNLSGCTSLVDLAPLKELSNLQWLSLWGCTSLVDLALLKELSNLQWLSLWGCTALVDLAPLKELSKLKWLDLSGCASLVDLAPLKELKDLEWLDLSGCTDGIEIPEALTTKKGLRLLQ